ncbi:CvpA family protein [Oscillospiraceae bacterium CM]|nr:CvpA family protein [Oscillospiraceae bacterium CM]
MSIAIDIILVLLVAFSAWRGYKNGFIRGIFGLLSIIAAIYGASLAASAFSSEVTGMIEPFVAGVVDKASTDVLKSGEAKTQDAVIKETDKTDVYKVSFAMLRDVGVAKSAASHLAEKVSAEITTVGRQMTDYLTNRLSDALSYVIVFALAFLLLTVIFAFVGNIINLAFSIPGVALPDQVIGLILGFAKGVLIVFALAVIVRYLGILSAGTIEKTTVLKYILNVNPLSSILGI